MAVTLTDNSITIKAKLTQAAKNALVEAGAEVAAHANRHVKLDGDAGRKLRGSYRYVANAGGDKVTVGTDLEEGYWEEFGTGSWADTSKNGGKKGRPNWWIYYEDMPPPYDAVEYKTQAEAEAAASRASAGTGLQWYASNGRKPAYTLENAFVQNKAKIIAEFERLIREGLA